MHGTRGSRAGVRRYICSTRRYSHDCDQPIVKAEPLEAQLVEWMRDFQPDRQLRTHVLDVIRAEAQATAATTPTRRRELHGQLDRLRDLYVLGDLTKNQYVHEATGDRGRTRAPRAADRPARSTKPKRCYPTSPASGTRSPRRRTAQADRDPLRPRLARRRHHRRRQAATAVRALLPTMPNDCNTASANTRRGVKGGSDGTRTRDLRRDRPAF